MAQSDQRGESVTNAARTALPPPDVDGGLPLAAAVLRRRSRREFARRELTTVELGQLLWAADGLTDRRDGRRAAPSAGALYPLSLYAATAHGLSRYDNQTHALEQLSARDLRVELAEAALGQRGIAEAACVLVFSAIAARTTRKYGERGVRYVHMEVGHAAQNVLLAATALGLAAYPVGAFDDARVAELLGLGHGEAALYLVPVGAPPEQPHGRR